MEQFLRVLLVFLSDSVSYLMFSLSTTSDDVITIAFGGRDRSTDQLLKRFPQTMSQRGDEVV